VGLSVGLSPIVSPAKTADGDAVCVEDSGGRGPKESPITDI